VTVRPGSGTYVTVSQDEFLARPLGWGIPMAEGRIQEAVEARRILEQAIVGLAAERASQAEIAEMRYHLAQMHATRKNRRKIIKADMSFHAVLAKAAHNSVLLNLFLQIRNLLQSFTERITSVPDLYDLTVGGHDEILKAIEARDAEGARAALCRHLDVVGAALASIMLSERPSEEKGTLGGRPLGRQPQK
jgi:GntR family transcriptional repressor for pyruvate dehydrogenase complex